jgi:hypothetical protein
MAGFLWPGLPMMGEIRPPAHRPARMTGRAGLTVRHAGPDRAANHPARMISVTEALVTVMVTSAAMIGVGTLVASAS